MKTSGIHLHISYKCLHLQRITSFDLPFAGGNCGVVAALEADPPGPAPELEVAEVAGAVLNVLS